MTGVLLPNGEQQFIDANGVPLAGGKVYFYVPDTLTPKTTWQDQAETIPNSNPITLDAAGRAVIWGTGSYRQIVKDSLGNLVWDQLTSDGGSSASGPGGSDKQLQYNDNGVFGGTPAIVTRTDAGTSVVITAADEITLTGDNISGTDINTPNAAAGLNSSGITVQPGVGGSGGRVAGDLNLYGGNGDPTDGYGGGVNVFGGNSGSSSGGPGDVSIGGGTANNPGGTNGIVRLYGTVIMQTGGLFFVSAYTVGSGANQLPAASDCQGVIAYVTDATAPAWGANVAGSGSAKALVWSNGANWTVIGK
jgi:hypothetical protein